NSTTATNGLHTLTAVARDAAGNTTISAGVSVTVNNTGPALPDVIVTSLSYAGGVFTSTVKNQGGAATPAGIAIGVAYSVDGVYRTWGGVTGPLAAGASVTIGTNGGSYTIPNGTHTIMAFADDVNRFAESNETNNKLSQLITVGAPDTQAPTVSVTAPANGATVSGAAVTVSATAADNVGVAGVQFKLDGTTNLGAEDTTFPYSVAWNSTTATNGLHTLTAVARDAAGNTTISAGVSVTVNNTGPALPDVIVTSLSYASGVFTSTVKNQGTAATPAGIAIGVAYSVDGVYRTWGGVSGPLAAGASVTIGTNGGPYIIPNGTHTITAFADDVNRFAESDETNNKLSQPITVGAPDTQAPTVSVTAPANGTTVSGSSVTVSANASDNVGVSGVQFKLDGTTNLGAEDTASPYSVAWNSMTATNGPHTLTAVARDAAGNTTTSAGVSVTVNNTGPALPDVIVTSLSYASGVFTSTVKNQGTAATPAGIAIGVAYSVDGVYRTWGGVSGPLAAGASVTIGTK